MLLLVGIDEEKEVVGRFRRATTKPRRAKPRKGKEKGKQKAIEEGEIRTFGLGPTMSQNAKGTKTHMMSNSWLKAEIESPRRVIPHRPRRYLPPSQRYGSSTAGQRVHRAALAGNARRLQEQMVQNFQRSRDNASREREKKRLEMRRKLQVEAEMSSVSSAILPRDRENPRSREKRRKAKHLYLLTNYLAFDKFTADERTDILGELLSKWMDAPYSDDAEKEIWGQVELLCESTFMLDRITSENVQPSMLSCVISCELLEILSRKDTKYKRVINVVKECFYRSLFVGYSNKKAFFDMVPWFEHAKRVRPSRHLRDPYSEVKRSALLSNAGARELATSIIERRGVDFAKRLAAEIQEQVDRAE